MKLFDRILAAWNTLRDTRGAQLLLQGPLPMWMQQIYETEADRTGIPVGSLLFDALRHDAIAIKDSWEYEETTHVH